MIQPRSRLMCYVATIYILIIIALTACGVLPTELIWFYSLSSLASYLLYYWDKQAAKNNERRTPEYSLHAWAIFGGWIGAAFAQHHFRHKTKKPDFQMIFMLSIIANIAVVAYLFIIDPWLKS